MDMGKAIMLEAGLVYSVVTHLWVEAVLVQDLDPTTRTRLTRVVEASSQVAHSLYNVQ